MAHRRRIGAAAIASVVAVWAWTRVPLAPGFEPIQAGGGEAIAPPAVVVTRHDAIAAALRRSVAAPPAGVPLPGAQRRRLTADDAAPPLVDGDVAATIAVAQHRVVVDPTLSDDERFVQFAALEAQLPDSLRATRAAAAAPRRLAEDEAALRAAGGSTEEIQALRERHLGSDAADRLAALDQQRAEWQGRVDTYRRERAAIDEEVSLTPAQREDAIEALRARRFSGPELSRIRALDGQQQVAAPAHR